MIAICAHGLPRPRLLPSNQSFHFIPGFQAAQNFMPPKLREELVVREQSCGPESACPSWSLPSDAIETVLSLGCSLAGATARWGPRGLRSADGGASGLLSPRTGRLQGQDSDVCNRMRLCPLLPPERKERKVLCRDSGSLESEGPWPQPCAQLLAYPGEAAHPDTRFFHCRGDAVTCTEPGVDSRIRRRNPCARSGELCGLQGSLWL